MTSETSICVWQDCYNDSWKGLIVDEAFTHPAKFSPGLIRRIVQHGLARDWWRRGDILGDPFGGIASGGVMAASFGMSWLGCELESRFVELGQRNIALHAAKWFRGEWVRLVQGDSRRFAAVVARELTAVVTSPPFATGDTAGPEKLAQRTDPAAASMRSAQGWGGGGQISEGNIAALKTGTVDGAITSPPYEGTDLAQADRRTWSERMDQIQRAIDRGDEVGPEFRRMLAAGVNANSGMRIDGYGDADGQIGNEKAETYWSAMALVYRQCLLALRPGGYMAVVVKDYVKDKARVPLCDQTLELLAAVGFTPVERIRAMLVKTTTRDGLFGSETKTTSRKSFFRRLAEKKGSPRIDWEEVIVIRKPIMGARTQ